MAGTEQPNVWVIIAIIGMCVSLSLACVVFATCRSCKDYQRKFYKAEGQRKTLKRENRQLQASEQAALDDLRPYLINDAHKERQNAYGYDAAPHAEEGVMMATLSKGPFYGPSGVPDGQPPTGQTSPSMPMRGGGSKSSKSSKMPKSSRSSKKKAPPPPRLPLDSSEGETPALMRGAIPKGEESNPSSSTVVSKFRNLTGGRRSRFTELFTPPPQQVDFDTTTTVPSSSSSSGKLSKSQPKAKPEPVAKVGGICSPGSPSRAIKSVRRGQPELVSTPSPQQAVLSVVSSPEPKCEVMRSPASRYRSESESGAGGALPERRRRKRASAPVDGPQKSTTLSPGTLTREERRELVNSEGFHPSSRAF